jgi:amino acid transporter
MSNPNSQYEAALVQQHEHRLRGGVLGLFDSVVMGVAGSAPAYSIAATTTAMFGAVGFGGPAALLYVGFFMFGIVFAFNYLSRHDQSAGASYSWVRRAIHPALGWLSGWAVFISALIFMVIATFPAGSSLLSLFSDSAAASTGWVTFFGAIFFLLMVGAVAAGVTVTVRVQIIMSVIEVVLLVIFALLAFVHAHHYVNFTWSWFLPSIFNDGTGSGFQMATFTSGALLAAFYYWGWDVTANLNEETSNAKKTSGAGGLLGALIVFLLFELFTIGSNMALSTGQMTNENNAANILQVLGQNIAPGTPGKLIVVAVLLSTVATLETTLIQVTRTLFVMGRDKTLPSILGTTHVTRKSPFVATMVVAVLSLLMFIGSQYIGSISQILSDGYAAIGIQICFYYGLAGLSVVILYRKQLFKSVKNFLFMGLWPLLGALFMIFVLIKDLPTLDGTTKLIGVGLMAVGLIPMSYYWFVKKSPYFNMPTREEREVVLEEFEQNL